MIDRTNTYCGQEHHVWALTNHDAKRLVSRWGGEDLDDETRIALSKLAAALLCALPGQLSFFQGEELGLPNAPYAYGEIKDPQGLRFWPKETGRDPIRHPMPWSDEPGGGFTTGQAWLPIKGEVAACHAKRPEPLGTWRELVRLRQTTPALRYGSAEILKADDEEGVLGILRTFEGERCEAWFGTSTNARPLPKPDGEVLAKSEGRGYGYRIVRT